MCPRCSKCALSARVFVRFPLCAIATCPPTYDSTIGCALQFVLPPVVEWLPESWLPAWELVDAVPLAGALVLAALSFVLAFVVRFVVFRSLGRLASWTDSAADDRILRDLKPTPRTSLAQQLKNIALEMKRRSVVILISDLLTDVEDVLSGLEHLRFGGHGVIVFHTMDPYELTFPFDGAWKFNGLEGEGPLITQPERIRDEYMAALGTFLATLQDGCMKSMIEYVQVDTSRPLDEVLSKFLAGRGMALDRAVSGSRS